MQGTEQVLKNEVMPSRVEANAVRTLLSLDTIITIELAQTDTNL